MKHNTKDGWEFVTEDEKEQSPDPNRLRPRIVVPDKEHFDQIMRCMYDSRRCGNCGFFLLRQGQELVHQGKIILEAVHDHNHNAQWYGNQNQYGLCDQWEGHLASALGPIRIPRSFLDSSVSYEEKDQSVECPYYKPRGKGMRSLRHYVGKRRNYEE